MNTIGVDEIVSLDPHPCYSRDVIVTYFSALRHCRGAAGRVTALDVLRHEHAKMLDRLWLTLHFGANLIDRLTIIRLICDLATQYEYIPYTIKRLWPLEGRHEHAITLARQYIATSSGPERARLAKRAEAILRDLPYSVYGVHPIRVARHILQCLPEIAVTNGDAYYAVCELLCCLPPTASSFYPAKWLVDHTISVLETQNAASR